MFVSVFLWRALVIAAAAASTAQAKQRNAAATDRMQLALERRRTAPSTDTNSLAAPSGRKGSYFSEVFRAKHASDCACFGCDMSEDTLADKCFGAFCGKATVCTVCSCAEGGRKTPAEHEPVQCGWEEQQVRGSIIIRSI